jgi:putative hydrolase of the HAD superfamily
MRPVRAVMFDAGGTLLHPQPPAADLYASVGRRYGSRLGPDVLGPRFADAFRREEEFDRQLGWRTGEIRELQRWQRIVAMVLDDVAEFGPCFRELYRHYGRPEAWAWDPDAGAVLEELAGRGYVLGVGSNYDHRLHTVLKGQPAAAHFRLILASADVGWRKPEAAFFAAVCERLNLSPEEVLFVGDDRANDYDGAVRAGLRAVLLDPRGKVDDPAVRRIASLRELPAELP